MGVQYTVVELQLKNLFLIEDNCFPIWPLGAASKNTVWSRGKIGTVWSETKGSAKTWSGHRSITGHTHTHSLTLPMFFLFSVLTIMKFPLSWNRQTPTNRWCVSRRLNLAQGCLKFPWPRFLHHLPKCGEKWITSSQKSDTLESGEQREREMQKQDLLAKSWRQRKPPIWCLPRQYYKCWRIAVFDT